MSLKMPDLPYDSDALEPFMSKKTLEFHYGKHHAGYVRKLNKQIDGTDYENMGLENIVKAAASRSDDGIFNNAAQSLNHEIFWNSLSPAKDRAPTDLLKDALQRDFGSIDEFRNDFRQAALGLFGSGWVWLVSDSGTLKIVTTGNAGCPIVDDLDPLLTLDVWEHAYYLDVQNDRAAYVDRFLDQLINWQYASEQFQRLDKAA